MAKDKRTRDEVVGDTALDLWKLIFGGIILTGIFNSSINKIVLMLGGLVVFAAIMLYGVYMITKK